MKKFVIGVVVLSFITSSVVFAEPTDVNLDIIRTNCNAARSTIQRVVSGDKTSRINRGRAYDRMSRLMINFSERLRQNGIDNRKFVGIANEFSQATASFRTNYDDYKISIDGVINRECVSRPADFYEDLLVARDKRRKLNDNTIHLNEIAERYKSAVSELRQSLYGEKTNEQV